MSVTDRTPPVHECRPLHPERVETARAAGYREWAHTGDEAWARAQVRAFGRVGLTAIVEAATPGWIVLVRPAPALAKATARTTAKAAGRPPGP